MADPTPAELQGQIDEINRLIKTEYQPPSTDEYSYPVVGQPMDDKMWQYVTLANGDGVLDEGGQPYWLRNNGTEANTNSTNTMLLTVSTTVETAQAGLRGFFHRLMEDKTLSFPGVTAETTYYVVLRYDPTDHTEPTGPISVRVVTSLDRSSGKHYIVLWKLTRKPNQLLTDALIERVRPKITPMITVDSFSHLPDASSVMWGTRAHVMDTQEEFRAGGATEDGPRTWLPMIDTYVRGDGSYIWPAIGARPGSTRIGNLIVLEGRVARGSGADFEAGREHVIMTLPVSHRPPSERRFTTKGPGTANVSRSATIVVSATGEVAAYAQYDMSWVGLDGCVFTLRS